MRGDIDLREIPWSRLRSPRWRIGIGIAVVLVVGAGFVWHSITSPPRPWFVRWKLDRYLQKQAQSGDFEVDFPFPPKAEMVAPISKVGPIPSAQGSRTGKSFDTLRQEYFVLKGAALDKERRQTQGSNTAVAGSSSNANAPAQESAAPIPDAHLTAVMDDLWEFQRQWMTDSSGVAGGDALGQAAGDFTRQLEQRLNTAGSYEAMYLAIGQELFVAQRLLQSANPAHRRTGATIAIAAARHALDHAVNGAVAARIAEGYLLPNLELAIDPSPRSPFHHQSFLRQCADLFRRNNELQNVARTYEHYLEHTKDRSRTDWAWSQVAMAYEEDGEPARAVAAIRQIRDTNAYSRLLKKIPRLEEESGVKRE